jgi:hypothetical protein
MSQERKLDQWMPPPEMKRGIKEILILAGMHPSHIDPVALDTYAAAACKYLSTTDEGIANAMGLFRFHVKRGEPDKSYTYTDTQTRVEMQVRPEDVGLIYGCTLRGKPVSPSQVQVFRREMKSCESCGVQAHCTKDIRNPGTDKISTLCNTCISLSDDHRISQYGHLGDCRTCVATKCFHHPAKRA